MKKIFNFLGNLFFKIKNNEFIQVLLILILIITLSSFTILYIEKDKNPEFVHLLDGLWYTIVSMATVGYGDKVPVTVQGKIAGIVIILFGVVFMGAVTGKIASFLVERQLKAGQGFTSLKKLINHFIICGWKKELPKLLEDILTVNKDLDIENVVLINSIDPQNIQDLKSDRRYAKIKFIYGDFADETVLRRANIQRAKTILVLADQTNPAATSHEIDSKTVIAVMTIGAITKRIYTCAELLDAKFETYLKLANCDEIILSRDYSRIVLANASAATGISHVINNLIDVNSATPVKVIPFPETFIGKPIGELVEFFNKKEGDLLIGILENTGNIYQRKEEILKEVQKTPDISKLVESLQMVKKIIPNDPIINPGANYIVKKNSRAVIIPINKKILSTQELKHGKKRK